MSDIVAATEATYISYYQGELYVSSPRKGNRQPFSNIGISRYSKRRFYEPLFIDSLTCDCFTAQPTLSGDGSMMAFTSNRYNENFMDTDIWFAYNLGAGLWGQITGFDMINTEYRETTPFFYGDTLFFASEGLGGQGGLDLFYTVFESGVWSRPVAVNINTPYNESDPYVDGDGNLIFASDRPGGAGGFDLYFAKKASTRTTPHPQIDINLKSFVSQIKLVEKNESIEIPIPRQINFDSPISEEFNLKEYLFFERNILLDAYADYFKGIEDREHPSLTIIATISNKLESENEKNQKYYTDKRIANFFRSISNTFQSKFGVALQSDISRYFKIEYEIGQQDHPTNNMVRVNSNEGKYPVYTKTQTHISLEPDKLAFEIQCDTPIESGKWNIVIDSDSTIFVGEGNQLPATQIEYPITLNPTFSRSINGFNHLNVIATLFSENGSEIGSDIYNIEISRSATRSVPSTRKGNDLIFDFYVLKELEVNPTIKMLQNNIGSRIAAASSLNIVYKDTDSSRPLSLADKIEKSLKNQGIFIPVKAEKHITYQSNDTDTFFPDWVYLLRVKIPIAEN